MTENSARSRAVQERMALRSDADRPVTRFGRSGLRKAPRAVHEPLSEASRAAAEAAWRRYGGGETSRFGRDRGPAQ